MAYKEDHTDTGFRGQKRNKEKMGRRENPGIGRAKIIGCWLLVAGFWLNVMTSGKAGGLENREPLKADYK
jgi:hypothetical protein